MKTRKLALLVPIVAMGLCCGSCTEEARDRFESWLGIGPGSSVRPGDYEMWKDLGERELTISSAGNVVDFSDLLGKGYSLIDIDVSAFGFASPQVQATGKDGERTEATFAALDGSTDVYVDLSRFDERSYEPNVVLQYGSQYNGMSGTVSFRAMTDPTPYVDGFETLETVTRTVSVPSSTGLATLSIDFSFMARYDHDIYRIGVTGLVDPGLELSTKDLSWRWPSAMGTPAYLTVGSENFANSTLEVTGRAVQGGGSEVTVKLRLEGGDLR